MPWLAGESGIRLAGESGIGPLREELAAGAETEMGEQANDAATLLLSEQLAAGTASLLPAKRWGGGR